MKIELGKIADQLFTVCINHRGRFGFNEMPSTNDCTTKTCKTGCPIKRMPKALTDEELDDIEQEVIQEELLKRKDERLTALQSEG